MEIKHKAGQSVRQEFALAMAKAMVRKHGASGVRSEWIAEKSVEIADRVLNELHRTDPARTRPKL